jgi:hypothetical protein
MLTEIIVYALISCPTPFIDNYTDTWDKVDQAHLDSAISRCPQIYEDAPCVKIFTKKEDRVYSVICGKP